MWDLAYALTEELGDPDLGAEIQQVSKAEIEDDFKPPMLPRFLISGGQTGADRAALDVGLASHLPVRGWVPLGRRAEDGVIPSRYPNLREARSSDPAMRTELNVRDSDGTLILSHGPLTGGSLLTEQIAERLEHPVIHLDLSQKSRSEAAVMITDWLVRHSVEALNVAGPRASEDPRIYEATRSVLGRILATSGDRGS